MNSGSLTMAAKAARSATTRSAGTPGVVGERRADGRGLRHEFEQRLVLGGRLIADQRHVGQRRLLLEPAWISGTMSSAESSSGSTP